MRMCDLLLQKNSGALTVYTYSSDDEIVISNTTATLTMCSHRCRRERQSDRKSLIFNVSRRRTPARAARHILDSESVEES